MQCLIVTFRDGLIRIHSTHQSGELFQSQSKLANLQSSFSLPFRNFFAPFINSPLAATIGPCKSHNHICHKVGWRSRSLIQQGKNRVSSDRGNFFIHVVGKSHQSNICLYQKIFSSSEKGIQTFLQTRELNRKYLAIIYVLVHIGQ